MTRQELEANKKIYKDLRSAYFNAARTYGFHHQDTEDARKKCIEFADEHPEVIQL